MDAIPANPVLQFEENTLKEVRKIHGLENPVEMKQMVDALEICVRERYRLDNKDFLRHLLETTIISSKGSLQKAQTKLENVCKWRSERPQFFGNFDINTDFKEFDGVLSYGILSKCTENFDRIWIVKFGDGKLKSDVILQYSRICILMCEYLRIHDYSDGAVIIVDLLQTRLLEALRRINLQDLRQASTILIEGYGVRIKAIHILSSSKIVNVFVWLLKQILNAKLISRVYVHRSVEAMHNAISFKTILPVEYDGDEITLKEVHENWMKELSSETFRRHLGEMSTVCSA